MIDRIGPYQITRELGRGGMGVVYLATDTRLDRQVAIKALPPELASDPARLERFEREARTLAQLNHPNLAGIHGVEEQDGSRYLVLEYVEGQTLAETLDRGPLPVDEAIELAVQIAAGVEAAHEAGVVHRDLKPGNIIITPEGQAKVLDFGLARIEETSSSSVGGMSDSPTLTSPAIQHSPTMPGVILGTAAYMSPEQARGRRVDKRTDIWSFGVVLYEMLVGTSPFHGETVSDSIGAVLHKDLDFDRLPPGTPANVRRALRRCLNRDKSQRLRDMGDVALELRAADEPAEAVAARPASGTARIARFAAVFLLGAAVIGGAMSLRPWGAASPSPDPVPRAHLTIPVVTDDYRQPSRQSGFSGIAVVSPDGEHVVFQATGADDKQRLWVRSLGDASARPLPDTTGAQAPFWSPDGRAVAFAADGRLWAVNISGGARRLITSITEYYGASWGANDVILLGQFGGGLVRVPAAGGLAEEVTTLNTALGEAGHVRPHFLPDGQSFLFVAGVFQADDERRDARLYAGRLDSDRIELISDINSSVWYVDSGHLLFIDDGTIVARPFDASRRRFTGDPIRIADNVWHFKPTAAASLSVSRGGVICFVPPVTGHELTWWDLEGRKLEQVGPSGAFDRGFRISPAGDKVAIGVVDTRTSLSDIWIRGLDRGTSARLTTDYRWEGDPVWSPDGSMIYYAWDRDGAPDIFERRADGTGTPRKIYEDPGAWFPCDISPDGETLVITTLQPVALRLLPVHGEGEARPLHDRASHQINGRVSPDARWIARQAYDTGRAEIYIEPFGREGQVVQVSTGGGELPVWSPDARRLYYLRSGADASDRGSTVMVVEFESEADYARPSPRILFDAFESITQIEVRPDGDRLLVMTVPSEPPPIQVILNWQHMLAKKKAP